MREKILVLDIGLVPYSFTIAKALKKAGYNVVLGIPLNEELELEFLMALRDYEKILYPDPIYSQHMFLSWIKEMQYREKFHFIIPCLESTQLVIAKIKDDLESLGVIVPIPEYEVLSKVVNKVFVLKKAEELGLKIPKTLILYELPNIRHVVDELGLPFILKVSSEVGVPPGLGSRFYVFKRVSDQRYFERVFNKLSRAGPVIAQQYLEGIGVGAEFLFNRFSEPIAIMGHKRVVEAHYEGGPSVSAHTYIHPSAVRWGLRLLKSLGWKGVAMVEFRETNDGGLFFMELNPRFWGTTPLALNSGVNFAKLLVEYFNEPKPKKYLVGYPKATSYYVKLGGVLNRLREDVIRFGTKNALKVLITILKNVNGRICIAERYAYPLAYFPLHYYITVFKRKYSTVSKIVDNIYIGPAPDNEKILSKIKKMGIDCIVDLREKHEVKDNAILKRVTRSCYYNVPVRDDYIPSEEELDRVIMIIDNLLKTNKKVYINCRLGRGRSPTILAAYMISKLKIPLSYIYLLLLLKRPAIRPSREQFALLYRIYYQTLLNISDHKHKRSDYKSWTESYEDGAGRLRKH